ncbi:MAG: response regulator transcription factor [Oscillospiraceae bacterium]|nr:response regulator transcription factor [Oscillospiraceae bacterium]
MIYFIEDDDNIRKLVCYALSHEGYEVTGLSTPRAFRAKLHSCLPELILLDIMLPEEDGLSILKWLKSEAATENIPVIMLTAKGSEFDKVTGLDLGADDYISKPFGMTELLSRVRAVLRRYEKTRIPSEKTYSIGKLFVDPSKHIIEVASSPVTLSFKEYSLLLMLLEADGRVVSRNDLLTKIWGEFYDDSRTLDVHIRKLRVKLGICGELIRTVKSIGYKLGGDGDE